MSCKCASFDEDEGRYYCEVSGSQCMYLIPSSKRCAEDFGEGPDAENEDDNINETISISDLIEALEEIKEKHGDIEVYESLKSEAKRS